MSCLLRFHPASMDLHEVTSSTRIDFIGLFAICAESWTENDEGQKTVQFESDSCSIQCIPSGIFSLDLLDGTKFHRTFAKNDIDYFLLNDYSLSLVLDLLNSWATVMVVTKA